MRVLTFIVDGQVLKPDPDCDFTGLFPGREDRIEAEFIFSLEWDSMIKVAAFWSMLGKEYPPQVLDDTDVCVIPQEATSKPVFKVQVIGKSRGNNFRTNTVSIYQRGGAK